MKHLTKVLSAVVVASMVLPLAACGNSNSTNSGDGSSSSDNNSSEEGSQGETGGEDYTYGLNETFHSDELISYSCMFSDNEAYPYTEDWRIFDAIKERTNVDLESELVISARTEYEDQKSLLVNTGDAPYIIPKTYEEAAYVAGGQIVAISDYVQYMPNYMDKVEKWGLESDLTAKLQADGKYYVLPGIWENAGGGYSYIIRKDVFEAAGVDVEDEEKDWTYEEFYEALKKVKDYTGSDYVWSDQFEGQSTLNIAAVEYGVTGGWGLANGMKFDREKEEFYFADATDNFKEYVSYFNKLIDEDLLDPESFTQENDQARAKFFRGDTYVINANYQMLPEFEQNMQVEDAELYMVIQPGGPAGNLQIENSRLENGVMISQNALDDLGEEGFIKMLRFVDWLWYSDEGLTLTLWGEEGTTYTVDSDGTIVLDPDITYNGINVDTATKKLNVDYGFGGGVFAYGGSNELRLSKMTDGEKDYNNRILENRDERPIDPPIMATTDQSEDLNLISTPLMDYVSTMTLSFITGQADIDTEWDKYVESCLESYRANEYVETANQIFAETKEVLGY